MAETVRRSEEAHLNAKRGGPVFQQATLYVAAPTPPSSQTDEAHLKDRTDEQPCPTERGAAHAKQHR